MYILECYRFDKSLVNVRFYVTGEILRASFKYKAYFLLPRSRQKQSSEKQQMNPSH